MITVCMSQARKAAAVTKVRSTIRVEMLQEAERNGIETPVSGDVLALTKVGL